MTFRITSKFFTQGLARKNFLPSTSHQVLKACQSSFQKHPSSYTYPSMDKCRISYPSMVPSSLMLKRAFSSSLQVENSSLLDECLEKIEHDPGKIREILKSLSPELHEKLALSLLEKKPGVLFPYLLLFSFNDKKILTDICHKLFSSDKLTDKEKYQYRWFLFSNFKDFSFSDKDFIVKMTSLALRNYSENFSFSSLGITDPEIIKETLLHLSKKSPVSFLKDNKNITECLKSQSSETLKKIFFNIIENSPDDSLENGYKSYGSIWGSSTLNIFAKNLPLFTKDPKILEIVALRLAEKDPKSLIAALSKLGLSKDILEKMIPKVLLTAKDSNTLEILLKDISLLGIKDPSFMEKELLTLSLTSPDAMMKNVKVLHLPENILQKVILKVFNTKLNENDESRHFELSLEEFIKELPSLGIQNQEFIASIVKTIAEKQPLALAGRLKSFNLPQDVLQEVIVKIVDAALSPTFDHNHFDRFWYVTNIVKELPDLGIQDQNLIISLVKHISNQEPLALTRILRKLHLNEDVLKEVIHKIFDKTEIDVNTRPYFFAILKSLPTLLSDDTAKAQFCEKILSSFLKDPQSHQYLNIENSREILKILPSYNLNKHFLEESVLQICKRHPRSCLGLLKSLSLEEDILKKIILEQLDIDRQLINGTLLHYSNEALAYLNEVLNLGIKDANFINEALLLISSSYSQILSLKDFPFTDKKTFAEIIENYLGRVSDTEQFYEFLQEIKTYDIKEPEYLLPIVESILNFHTSYIKNSVLEKLMEKDPNTKLPFFVHLFGMEDLSIRKKMAKSILKNISEYDHPYIHFSHFKKLGISLKLLGLKDSNSVQDLLTEEKVSNSILYKLCRDPSILEHLPPSFFLDRWEAESKELASTDPSSQASCKKSIKTLTDFFQRPEIKEAFSENELFRTYLLQSLTKLIKSKDTSALEKLDTLIKLCQADAKPLPPVKEITGYLIFSDVLSSNYHHSVYLERLKTIQSLNIENLDFWKRATSALSLEKSEDFVASLDQFPLLNSEMIETAGVNILFKNLELFKKYKTLQNLPKSSLLKILTNYGAKLHNEGKCILVPQVTAEVFSQITKYRNETLSDIYLNTFLENITSENYQKAFGFYTLTGKTKKDLIFIHKILPGIFLGKWDNQLLESNLSFRNKLSNFLTDSNIRKTLRDPTKPLIQNLLFAASSLDKDLSLLQEQKLKLFSQVCALEKESQPSSTLEIADNLRTLRFICSLSQGSSLDHTFTKSAKEELSAIFKQLAIDRSLVPGLAKIENIEQKYIQTFVTEARIPGSLATYESDFYRCPSRLLAQGFFEDLSRFVHMCLEKDPKGRYRTDINPDLQELSERFPDKFEKWKESLPPIELESTSSISKVKHIKDLISLSSIEEELKEYKGNPLLATIQNHLKSLSNKIADKESLELLQLIEKDLYLLNPIPMDALKSIEKALSLLKTSSGKQKLIVKDIDDPLTLFEIPTLVCYSCQNITAQPQYKQCLVSYSISGTIRMPAILDISGNFLARSVLRLCFDEHLSPFLLLEPVYKSNKISQDEAEQCIYEGALQKAEYLDVPLFTKVSTSLGSSKTIVTKGVGTAIYYSDFSFDKEESHRILGKVPQNLTTAPVIQITRDQFKGPVSWPNEPQSQSNFH